MNELQQRAEPFRENPRFWIRYLPFRTANSALVFFDSSK
jgi:hypothetical protein